MQLIGPKIQRRPGLVVRARAAQHTTRLGGLAVTTAAQTVADLLLTLPRAHAVSVLDSALQQRLLPGGPADVEPLLARRHGGDRARLLMCEADGRAESPLETRHRLLCKDAGLPPGLLQWQLEDPISGKRFRIDAGWPSRMVGVEADGKEVHGQPRALYEDRHRQNCLLTAHPGLILLRFTWEDALRPAEFLRRLTQALSR